jgi:hypothetical protein
MAINENDPLRGLFTPTLTGRPPAVNRINNILLASASLSSWRRMLALAWYLLLVGYPISQGKVNSRNHSGSFDGYFVMYSCFVIVYLAATSVLGVGAQPDIPRQEE